MALLTPEELANATVEQKLIHWQQVRASIGGVRRLRSRDKETEYDAAAVDKIIAELEVDIRRGTRRNGVVHSRRARH